MKTGYKILIIAAAVLAVMGITGAILIRFVFFREDDMLRNYNHYSRAEAEYLLELLSGKETVLPGEDENSFRAEDARYVLKELLELSDEQVEELLIPKDSGPASGLEFLDQKRDSYTLSETEFHSLYEYLIAHMENPAVSVQSILVLDYWCEGEDQTDTGQDIDGEPDDEQDVDVETTIEPHVVCDTVTYGIMAYSEERRRILASQISKTVDQCIRVYVYQDQLLCYLGISEEPVFLSNVWLEGISDEDEQQLDVFVNGYHKSYLCRLASENAVLTGDGQAAVQGQLADLALSAGKITDIVLKTDVITAKVLAVTDEGVELESYGVLTLSDHYKIYKIYGELAVEPVSQILVGYNTTNFVIADGVIEAALITEPIRAETIRVVLRNTDYSSLVHDRVVITSDAPFTLSFHDQQKVFEPGEELELTYSGGYMANGRVMISSNVENGMLTVTSIQRNNEYPTYRGTLEVAPYGEDGLIIVNELSLEEYLYAVVPSEMPTSYGDTALQVQAICARGYAYMKMQDGAYAKYGAHLDDSTMTQVYHSVNETEESVLAVKETYGLVPVYDSSVIQAYFFSTSCGTTCNNSEVWDGEALPYLKDKLEGTMADDDNILEPVPVDFSSEEDFRAFIQGDTAYDMYEQEYPFYRWSVDFTQEELSQAVRSTLAERYAADPTKILTRQPDESYISQPIEDIGDIVSVQVTKRGVSGIVKELLLEGTKASILVHGQGNMRAVLTPYSVAIKRQDEAESIAWSMLPSPFYYIEGTEDGNYRIVGGGFGHGVGMSQNGAKALADRGYSAEEIIKHYYCGIDLLNIYR